MQLVIIVTVIYVSRLHSHSVFFFQAEDGIRDLVRSRGLGDVYKRQVKDGDIQKLITGEIITDANGNSVIMDAETGATYHLSLIHI